MAAIDLQLHMELDEILAALQEAGWVRPVRCRDCTKLLPASSKLGTTDFCIYQKHQVNVNGFCSDGKRKEDEDGQ